MTVLVVAAHPDDEVLGCGGTIARLSASEKVVIIIMGEGATSRAETRGSGDTQQVSALRRSAEAAAKVMGASELLMESLPDNRFDEVTLLDVVKRVERVIEQYQPSAIYTHHHGDLNIDHQVTARAVVTATRPMAGSPVAEVLSFEIASSSEWSFGTTGEAFAPNVFTDISSTLDKKIAAMRCYESEMRPYPHPRSEEALRAIAMKWGSTAGVQAAEAFQLIRAVR